MILNLRKVKFFRFLEEMTRPWRPTNKKALGRKLLKLKSKSMKDDAKDKGDTIRRPISQNIEEEEK